MKTLFHLGLSLPLMVIPMLLAVTVPLDAVSAQFENAVGRPITITFGHSVALLGALALTLELVKSTSLRSVTMVDHIFSVALLIFSALAFWSMPLFASAWFLLLVCLQAVDVIVGVVVTIRVARRDFGIPTSGLG